MKNRNAYIVKDSKTYLYAEEAKFKLADEADLNILFLVIPRVTNNRLKERMEELISPEEWDKVCWFLTLSNGTDFLEMKHRKMNELTRNFKKVREYFYHFIDNVRMKRRARQYRPCKFAVSTHKNTHEKKVRSRSRSRSKSRSKSIQYLFQACKTIQSSRQVKVRVA